MSRPSWTNRLAFILTVSSFAVGVGNIWRFPYMVGEGGGGAFLLVYIVMALLIGIPIMLAEISLGRMAGTTPLVGFGKLSGKPVHNLIGWVEVVATMLIMGFYVMIMAWIGVYFWQCLSGELLQVETTYASHFASISASSGRIFFVSLLILGLSAWIIGRGLKDGVEALAKLFMPLLLLLIVVLGIWSCTRPGAGEGIRWYLTPDFSKIGMDTFLGALSQIFFSIGIGMAAVFVFGSYSDKKQNIILDTGIVVFMDTLIAFLAGFVIFPALFSYGIAPDSGPSLLFITMTGLLGELPMGQLFGALFFALLLLAGLTSVVTLTEGLVQSLRDRFRLSQGRSIAYFTLVVILLLIPNILSHNDSIFSDLGGRSFFEITDFVSNSILLPIAGLLIVVFGMYVVGFDRLRDATNEGSTRLKVTAVWEIIWKVVVPISIVVILITGVL